MPIIDGDPIYTVTAGDPKEDDKNKIFLSKDKTFKEADALFTSLLWKDEYPVLLLDEGNITIRGFKAPDRDEWDERYTILKEDLYRKSNPDKKPLYVILAYNNNYPDTWYSGAKKKPISCWKVIISAWPLAHIWNVFTSIPADIHPMPVWN
jgi:hypothetical protein